jgi:hypothetical protein
VTIPLKFPSFQWRHNEITRIHPEKQHSMPNIAQYCPINYFAVCAIPMIFPLYLPKLSVGFILCHLPQQWACRSSISGLDVLDVHAWPSQARSETAQLQGWRPKGKIDRQKWGVVNQSTIRTPGGCNLATCVEHSRVAKTGVRQQGVLF